MSTPKRKIIYCQAFCIYQKFSSFSEQLSFRQSGCPYLETSFGVVLKSLNENSEMCISNNRTTMYTSSNLLFLLNIPWHRLPLLNVLQNHKANQNTKKSNAAPRIRFYFSKKISIVFKKKYKKRVFDMSFIMDFVDVFNFKCYCYVMEIHFDVTFIYHVLLYAQTVKP